MKKIIRLTESDLARIVRRVIKENEFRLSPEHVIHTLNRDVINFIESQDLDKEESFKRLDYFIKKDVKPILDKAKENSLWTDKEINEVIRYLKYAYNYDYYSGKELPPPDYIF